MISRQFASCAYLSDVITDPTHSHVNEQETDGHDEEHQSEEVAAALIQLRSEYVHDIAQEQGLTRVYTS